MVMGIVAWGCWRGTLTGTTGVSVCSPGAKASPDAACCLPDPAGAQQWLVLNDIWCVFTADFNNSMQPPANHHLAQSWFTFSPSALGHSEAILCVANLRVHCGPRHFLLPFAFTFPIRSWWRRRCIIFPSIPSTLIGGQYNCPPGRVIYLWAFRGL